jgi:predicted AlkP superfamily phosphohydrolase/phosphomutase
VILVLGFDSASVPMLERMLAAGDLPNLAATIGRGRRLSLRTPATDFAAGAFYSLYSGVELADHGIFYPFQWSAGEQRARYVTAFEAPAPVWERLADAGLRTLAIDPYESRPPSRANGVFVCGWGFSDRVVLPRWSYPAGIGRRLERSFGRGPRATEVFGTPTPAQLLRLREKLLAAPARIAALARELLARESFDLTWLTFSAAHLGGHAFWDLSQLDPEALDEATSRLLAGTLEEIYAEVDRALGSVLEAIGPEADVIVTSAVGMDVNASRADLLPEMLAAVLSGRAADEERSEGGAIWRLRGAVPVSARQRIADAIPRRLALDLTARLEMRGHSWPQTQAFAHPADNQGYIRLNLRGREAEGIVEPGAEAEELVERLEAGLRTFTDPDGSPAVAGIVRVGELYRGEHTGRLPDLSVRWSERPATTITHLHSDRHGTVHRHGGGSGRSGNHTPGGAWAVLAPGTGSHIDQPEPRLEDIAATICELASASADGLVGRPLLSR